MEKKNYVEKVTENGLGYYRKKKSTERYEEIVKQETEDVPSAS